MRTILSLVLIALMSIMTVQAQNTPNTKPNLARVTQRPSPRVNSPEMRDALPKAVIYKMNGDWSQYVPVKVTEDGTALLSFPAPTDIKNFSTPISVGDGYWLDRRGIGPNTAFTRWTYAEYASLKTPPTPEEILNNLIPGAAVTEILELPMIQSVAAQEPVKVRRLIAEGLKGAVIRYRLPGTVKPQTSKTEEVLTGEPGPKGTILTESVGK